MSQVTYDADGNVRGVQDASGNWAWFDRDGFGQAWKVTSPATDTAVEYTYDAAGNLLTKTDARGKLTTYTYDDLDRLLSIQAGAMPAMRLRHRQVIDDAGTQTFTHNEAGEIRARTSVVDGTTLRMSYTYDNMARVDVMTLLVLLISLRNPIGCSSKRSRCLRQVAVCEKRVLGAGMVMLNIRGGNVGLIDQSRKLG